MDPTTKESVFWMGDSIALHYQPYLLEGLRGFAEVDVRQGYQEAIRDLDHPRGSNCGDSSMVLAFLREMLGNPRFTAKWIVFNCGLHDIKTNIVTGERQIGENTYAENLQSILSLIRAQARVPVWVTTTPIDDEQHRLMCQEMLRYERDVSRYNSFARLIMQKNGVPCFDLHHFTSNLPGELYIDHAHFTEKVRILQGTYLSSKFRALLNGKNLR